LTTSFSVYVNPIESVLFVSEDVDVCLCTPRVVDRLEN